MGRTMILQVEDLSIYFGGLHAVEGVSFYIKEGQIVGLIGPNGAGKTTIFNLLTGVYKPTRGEIYLENKSVVGTQPYQINRLGMARTFQNIRLFKDMTVLDNVKIPMNNAMNYPMLSGVLRSKKYRTQERHTSRRAHELLETLGLEENAYDLARNLPYGKQRKLEIARALAASPKLLLLDEPAAGMNPTETQELLETIQMIREKFNLSVLLIEHDMNFVMGICEYIFVLDYGRLIAQGEPEQVRNNPQVIAAYLGGDSVADENDA